MQALCCVMVMSHFLNPFDPSSREIKLNKMKESSNHQLFRPLFCLNTTGFTGKQRQGKIN